MLDKLRKKKYAEMEKAMAELKVRKAELVADCEEVLRILKNSNHPSSMDFQELRYHFYRSKGIVSGGEDRILSCLRLLAGMKCVGWGGNKGDAICFTKSLMPTQLQGLVQ